MSRADVILSEGSSTSKLPSPRVDDIWCSLFVLANCHHISVIMPTLPQPKSYMASSLGIKKCDSINANLSLRSPWGGYRCPSRPSTLPEHFTLDLTT